MTTKKFIVTNIVSVAVLIIITEILPWGDLTNNIRPSLRWPVTVLIKIMLYAAFYFIMVLALGKDKCLASKPLFDSSQSFADNIGLAKIVILVLLQLARYTIPKFIYPFLVYFGGAAAPIFRMIVDLVHWTLVYFILVGKKENIFTVGKYAGATVLIVILAYGISTAVTIEGGRIVAENAVATLSGDMTVLDALSAVSDARFNLYMNIITIFNAAAETIAAGSIIAFHKLSLEYVRVRQEK